MRLIIFIIIAILIFISISYYVELRPRTEIKSQDEYLEYKEGTLSFIERIQNIFKREKPQEKEPDWIYPH